MKQSIGENMYHYRKGKGWTQQQLADAVGITSKYVSLIEQGHRKPSTEVLEKIADTLSVSVEDLTSKNPPEQRKARSMVQFLESYVLFPEEVRETLITIIKKELDRIK